MVRICCEQEYHFIGILHDEAVIFGFQCSPLVNGFDAEGKFHAVIVEDSGVDQSIIPVCLEMTFCFAVGAIAEYEVLFPGLAGCELHHHDAVRI